MLLRPINVRAALSELWDGSWQPSRIAGVVMFMLSVVQCARYIVALCLFLSCMMVSPCDCLSELLDGGQVPVIINYDFPMQPAHYMRRSSCCADSGTAISFVTKANKQLMQDVQSFFGIVIQELPANVADIMK